jgi:hypothetical protein
MKQPQVDLKKEIKTLEVSSVAFGPGGTIPEKYTCDGENINPPLHIEHIPEQAKSLVIIVEDPDAPSGTFTHWLVWNIPPSEKIKERSIPGNEGSNDYIEHHYRGPCPPSGMHHYHFKVYALDSLLHLKADTKNDELQHLMSKYVIAFGELVGVYKRYR